MSSDRELNRYQYTSSRLLREQHTPHRSNSLTIEPETSRTRRPTPFTQQPPSSNLFASLLFNRERVYKESSASFKPIELADAKKRQPTARVTEETRHVAQQTFSHIHSEGEIEVQPDQGGMSGMLSYLNKVNPMAPVRKGGERPAKKDSSKSKGKVEDDKSKKRPASWVTVHSTPKKQKAEANSGKKIDIKEPIDSHSSSALARSSTPIVIEISDDEDDEAKPDKNAQKQHEPARRPPKSIDNDFNMIKIDSSESESDLHHGPSRNNLENELKRLQSDHTQELLRLHQELEAANAETESVRTLMEKRIADGELVRVGSENAATRKYTALERELDAEREKLRAVLQEMDQMRIDIDINKTRYEELTTERDDLQRRHDKAQEDHESLLGDMIKNQEAKENTMITDLEEQTKTLVNENGRLTKEIEILKAAVAAVSLSQSSMSPAPSSSYTDEDLKNQNIRRTYTKVKRRFDNLHSVAVNISTCTRSMDLSSFGEFGQYLRQLKATLDKDGQERQASVVCNLDQDNDRK